MRRTLGSGLTTMGFAAVAAVIWPAVAGLVAGALFMALCAGSAVLAALAVRWVRGEMTWRRELSAVAPVEAMTYTEATPVATPVELRNSA